MCGLAGIILGKKERSKQELSRIRGLFTDLLVHSQHRGPFATGAAVIRTDGSIIVEKAPLSASELAETLEYRSLMCGLDNGVNCLMGHTRWPTRGTHLDNRNNHPLVSKSSRGTLCLTHSGTVTNATGLFERLELEREAEVDSEVLLRLAERNTDADGVDLRGLLGDIRLCTGRLSFAVVAGNRPGRVILVKGNQPLVVLFNHRLQVYAYASEPAILDAARCRGAQWERVCIPAWHALTIDTTGTAQLDAVPTVAKRGLLYSAWDV